MVELSLLVGLHRTFIPGNSPRLMSCTPPLHFASSCSSGYRRVMFSYSFRYWFTDI